MVHDALRVGLFRASEPPSADDAVEVRLDGVQTYRLMVNDTERGLMAVNLDEHGPQGLGAELMHRLEAHLTHVTVVRIATDAGEVQNIDWQTVMNAHRSQPLAIWLDQIGTSGPVPTTPLTVRAPADSGVDLAHLANVLRNLMRRNSSQAVPGFALGPPHDRPGVVWLTPSGVPPDQSPAICISIHMGEGPKIPDEGVAGLVAQVRVDRPEMATQWIESLFVATLKDFLPLPEAIAHAHHWQQQGRHLRMRVVPAWSALRLVRTPPWPGRESWHGGWATLYPGRWERALESHHGAGAPGVHLVLGPRGSGRTSFVHAGWLPGHSAPRTGDFSSYRRIRSVADFTKYFQRLDNAEHGVVAIIDDALSEDDPRLQDWSTLVTRVGERGTLVVISTMVPKELEGLSEDRITRLTLPDRDALIETLRTPAERLGYRFESGALEAVVDQAIARAPTDRLREASEQLRILWERTEGFVFHRYGSAAWGTARTLPTLTSDLSFDPSQSLVDQDQLDFARHINAFTALILSRETHLPLSVGLFGDWGSGKTFFMHSLAQSLMQQTRQIKAHSDDPSEWGPWHGRVVPIHFNAWHYADTDLWASLIHHLFRELGTWLVDEDAGEEAQTDEERNERAEADRAQALLDMVQRLQTTRSRVREAEVARDAIRKRLEHETGRRESAIRQGLMGLRHAAVVFATDVKTDLETPQGATHRTLSETERAEVETIVELAGEAEAVRTLLGERAPRDIDDVEQLVVDWSGRERWWRYLSWLVRGPRPWARLGFMLGLVGVSYLLHNLVDFFTLQTALCSAPNGGPWYCGALAPTASTVSWILGTTATTWGLFQSWLKRTAPGLWAELANPKQLDRRLKAFRTLIPRFEADRKAAARTLAEADAAVALAQQQLQAAERAVQEAESGIALRRFVNDGVGDRYRAHLGLMSTIHEDLDQLGSILSELEIDNAVARRQHQGEPEADRSSIQPPPPPRIVLFIDDLDRCPPKRVVEVLEAVHLLLAKELFVVVVAVDARWLMQSVDVHFRSLVDVTPDRSTSPKAGAVRVATPRQYLEKIFQVPFQVPPMSPSSYSRMVDKLVGSTDATEEVPEAASPETPPTESPAPVEPARPDVPETPSTEAAGPEHTPDDTETSMDGGSASPERPPLPVAQHVRFTTEERSVLRALAPLIRTPRSTKRVVNTARLIRLHGSREPDWDALCPVSFLLLSLEVGAWETWGAARTALIETEFVEPLSCMRRVADTELGRMSRLGQVLQYLCDRPGLSDDPRIWRRAMGLSERHAFLLHGGHTRE